MPSQSVDWDYHQKILHTYKWKKFFRPVFGVRADLPASMLYAWADLYSQQLHSGQNYRELRPTYAMMTSLSLTTSRSISTTSP